MICEEDLLWALNEGLVRAAGLDMLESENPDLTECKLMGRDDVLLMPHCGYFSDTSDYLVSKPVSYTHLQPISTIISARITAVIRPTVPCTISVMSLWSGSSLKI